MDEETTFSNPGVTHILKGFKMYSSVCILGCTSTAHFRSNLSTSVCLLLHILQVYIHVFHSHFHGFSWYHQMETIVGGSW